MRGQEFISSTPKYLSLYDALDIKRPEIATMPPILGEGGNKKLGKRDGAKDLLEYRTEGYLPEAMVNFLALLGWNPGTDEEVFSAEELMQLFDLSRVQKSGAQFNEEKLLHLNQAWMRKLSDSAFIDVGGLSAPDSERLLRLVPELKERAATFDEARHLIADELSYVFAEPELDPALLTAKETISGSTKAHLSHFLARFAEMPEGTGPEGIKAHLMPYADGISKEDGGRGAALWPLRYALSGKERSPDPFALIHILGLHEASSRVSRALGILGA
jgi:glutamyl/glutaminyl-tRNA synthetase